MGDKKNLGQQEALKEIQSLAKEINTCMFCTYDEEGKLKSRPMSVRKVDDDGNLWFLAGRNSDKNHELQLDNNVELLFAGGHEKYLSLHGTAEISFDKAKIKELWNPIAKIWFTEGENDPDISVIRVKYDDGYYWDTKHGHMVSLLKMAKSLVTGTKGDDGVEGVLKK
ncbi:MAG TPA: pyridoxamine 5'-phosphate oxidase family protein [Chitinophagaceae bacterium]|nr:pyridoxamine 5'-phosphate oxidase family protein [Chitinophagaceae bacterium]